MNLVIMSVIGFIVLTAYVKKPERFFLFLLLCMIILLLFYMAYGPERSRRRRAKKMASKKGEYRLNVTNTVLTYGENNQKIQLKEKKIKLYISNQMYTLKIEREVFAVPKRIMTPKQQELLMQMLRSLRADIININIKG